MRAFLAEGSRMKSRVGSVYSVPKEWLGSRATEDLKEVMTMVPKTAFGSAQAESFKVWSEDAEYLHLPRFYGLQNYGPAMFDDRVDGDLIQDVAFVGTLFAVQERAVETLSKTCFSSAGSGGGIVSIPCGSGKTVLAVYFITKVLKRKACILVHKAVIRDQWKAAFERFCPGIRVGVLGGTKSEIDSVDVVIAMVLTVSMRDYDTSVFDSFGTVCADECHHLGAKVMSRALTRFRARHVLGLTATKERPDGLTRLLHWSIGQEAFRAERDGGEKVRVTMAIFKPDASKECLNREGKPVLSIMLNRIAVDATRNRFISSWVSDKRAQGRVVMVLSDRLVQLDILRTMLVADGVAVTDIGVFRGSTPQREREEQLSRPVVLCSYGVANEGLDKREADTCVMATPKGRVVQCIGRIQRPCADKKPPLVLDVVDDFSVFSQLRWKRQTLYSREKYEFQTVNVPVDTRQTWFS